MRYYFFALVTFALLLSGCAQKELVQTTPTPQPKVTPDDTLKREAVVKKALTHLNKKDGLDCSGFVSLVNKESQNAFFNPEELTEHYEDSRRSLAIYNLLSDQNRTYETDPKAGDLIFFANTVKRYAKQKSVDNITHIGIVTKVDSDETIHFIHHTKGKNIIGYLNFSHPTLPVFEGKAVNSYMEKCTTNSHKCLAPAYFSAFGTLK